MSDLVLLRHGESTANADDVFGGWLDVDLTARGRREAVRAGELIRDAGLRPAAVHTSLLRRAVDTADLVLDALKRTSVEVHRSWQLNERHYGRLQGRTRTSVRQEFGDAPYDEIRRSYDVAPPPAGLPGAVVDGESLADVRRRVVAYWDTAVAADLRAGRTTIVVAHGNSLRALCMHLDGLSPQQVTTLNVPTGVPLLYQLDDGLVPRTAGGSYLDADLALAGIAEVRAQGRGRK
ncbi:2,3-diphosphoglycerate-dependent phosphoglycerate mutase [Mycobacterium sp. AT1]|uniref:2,3-bisphosphoglycerate-dependent phosphoglycerate mutase n=1 Tax=Mycobacterium sp. AT1 TaxID=1961706 RepID=UPI00269C62B6